MKKTPVPSMLLGQLRWFARWFFNSSPTALLDEPDRRDPRRSSGPYGHGGAS